MKEIEEKLKKILMRYSFNEAAFEKITDNSDLKNDLGINSARIIDIVLDIEEEFNINIDDKSISKIKTFGDTIEVIKLIINEN